MRESDQIPESAGARLGRYRRLRAGPLAGPASAADRPSQNFSRSRLYAV